MRFFSSSTARRSADLASHPLVEAAAKYSGPLLTGLSVFGGTIAGAVVWVSTSISAMGDKLEKTIEKSHTATQGTLADLKANNNKQFEDVQKSMKDLDSKYHVIDKRLSLIAANRSI